MEQVGHDSTDHWSATEPRSIGNLVSGFSLAVLEQVVLCSIVKYISAFFTGKLLLYSLLSVSVFSCNISRVYI